MTTGTTVVVVRTFVVNEPTGQLVTVGAHEVTVNTLVIFRVTVVYDDGTVAGVVVGFGESVMPDTGQTVV